MSELVPSDINLESLIESLQDQQVSEPSVKPGSRAAKRDKWQQADKLDDHELQLVKSLPDLVGSAPTPSEPTDLEQQEIDLLMREALGVREVQDILDGRYQAIRTTVFNVLNERGVGEDEPGELISEQQDMRFTREIRGGNRKIDWERFEKRVPPEVWESVTNQVTMTRTVTSPEGEVVEMDTTVSREPVEDRVLAALDDGRISMDDLAAATETTKRVASFHIRGAR